MFWGRGKTRTGEKRSTPTRGVISLVQYEKKDGTDQKSWPAVGRQQAVLNDVRFGRTHAHTRAQKKKNRSGIERMQCFQESEQAVRFDLTKKHRENDVRVRVVGEDENEPMGLGASCWATISTGPARHKSPQKKKRHLEKASKVQFHNNKQQNRTRHHPRQTAQ